MNYDELQYCYTDQGQNSVDTIGYIIGGIVLLLAGCCIFRALFVNFMEEMYPLSVVKYPLTKKQAVE